MICLKDICKYCNHWRYCDSDYGRCGADHYTCDKHIFNSTREDDWYTKAKECNLFKTSFILTDEELKEIGRTKGNR